MKKKHDLNFIEDKQCSFQIFGHRCELQSDLCLERHLLKAKYCDFHGREEYENSCIDSIKFSAE